MLFIDDNSPDGTKDQIKSLIKKKVCLFLLEKKLGIGDAYVWDNVCIQKIEN